MPEQIDAESDHHYPQQGQKPPENAGVQIAASPPKENQQRNVPRRSPADDGGKKNDHSQGSPLFRTVNEGDADRRPPHPKTGIGRRNDDARDERPVKALRSPEIPALPFRDQPLDLAWRRDENEDPGDAQHGSRKWLEEPGGAHSVKHGLEAEREQPEDDRIEAENTDEEDRRGSNTAHDGKTPGRQGAGVGYDHRREGDDEGEKNRRGQGGKVHQLRFSGDPLIEDRPPLSTEETVRSGYEPRP